jgi:hypothetical protein
MGFAVLSRPEAALLAHLPPEAQRSARKAIIAAILCTDMANHFKVTQVGRPGVVLVHFYRMGRLGAIMDEARGVRWGWVGVGLRSAGQAWGAALGGGACDGGVAGMHGHGMHTALCAARGCPVMLRRKPKMALSHSSERHNTPAEDRPRRRAARRFSYRGRTRHQAPSPFSRRSLATSLPACGSACRPLVSFPPPLLHTPPLRCPSLAPQEFQKHPLAFDADVEADRLLLLKVMIRLGRWQPHQATSSEPLRPLNPAPFLPGHHARRRHRQRRAALRRESGHEPPRAPRVRVAGAAVGRRGQRGGWKAAGGCGGDAGQRSAQRTLRGRPPGSVPSRPAWVAPGRDCRRPQSRPASPALPSPLGLVCCAAFVVEVTGPSPPLPSLPCPPACPPGGRGGAAWPARDHGRGHGRRRHVRARGAQLSGGRGGAEQAKWLCLMKLRPQHTCCCSAFWP